jgi:hypothetical protein
VRWISVRIRPPTSGKNLAVLEVSIRLLALASHLHTKRIVLQTLHQCSPIRLARGDSDLSARQSQSSNRTTIRDAIQKAD